MILMLSPKDNLATPSLRPRIPRKKHVRARAFRGESGVLWGQLLDSGSYGAGCWERFCWEGRGCSGSGREAANREGRRGGWMTEHRSKAKIFFFV